MKGPPMETDGPLYFEALGPSEPEDRQTAAAVGVGAHHAAAVPGRPGRSVRRNRESRGSLLHRKSGNQARRDDPLASDRLSH